MIPSTLEQWIAERRAEAAECGYRVTFVREGIRANARTTALFWNGPFYCYSRTFNTVWREP